MQKIIISFSLENIDVIKADINKTKCEIVYRKEIENSKLFTGNGTIDAKKAVTEIKNVLGKDIDLDVSIVLPDYMTQVGIYELEDLTKAKLKEAKAIGAKLNNKQVSYIGKNENYNMTQVIFYNKKSMSAFIREMHKQKINVVDVKSNYCVLENSLPLITDVMTSINAGETKTYLMVILGTNAINTMIMKNNMPVSIKNHSYSLYDLYSNIKESHNDLTFSDFIRAIKRANPYAANDSDTIVYLGDSEEAEGKRREAEASEFTKDAFSDDFYGEIETPMEVEDLDKTLEDAEQPVKEIINDKYDALIARELKTIFEVVCQEIRDLTDLVNEKYGGDSIEIVTNSKTAHRFIEYQLSDIFTVNENVNINKSVQIGDFAIESENENLDLSSLESLSLVICDIKKGAEFYE